MQYYCRLIFLCAVFLSFEADAQTISKHLGDYMTMVQKEYSGDNALATTAYVSELWRSPGNTGFDSSLYFVQNILEKAGFRNESDSSDSRLTYRLEQYPLRTPAWEPVAASIYLPGGNEPLLDFTTNRNLVCINSFSTPVNGIEAEVVYLESCDEASFEGLDLEGKIVFAECHPYTLFKRAIEKKGAIGLLSYAIPAYNQPEKYQNSIPFRSIPFNSEYKSWAINLSFAARKRIKAEIKKGPLKLRVKIETKIYPSEELTLIAEVRGSKIPEERFVYSAHVQEPGANDNATGVGAQAEMARVAAKLVEEGKLSPDRTLTFLWGVEIKSTRRYIEQDTARAAGIKWGMSLDMVGEDTEKTGGTFLIEKMPDPSAIWTRGKDKHTEWGASEVNEKDFNPHYFNDFIEFVCQRQAAMSNWTVNTNPYEGGSDHQPFLNANIPGLLLWHFTDVFYHTDADRIDKVSPVTLANVGISALTAGLMLTNSSEKIARDVLTITEQSALERLAIEGRLSQNEIKRGGNVAHERDILWTWGYWYAQALPKVKDILSNQPSDAILKELNISLKKIGNTTLKEMQKLN